MIKSTQIGTIAEGLHLLFTGTSGHKYGCSSKVQNCSSRSQR